VEPAHEIDPVGDHGAHGAHRLLQEADPPGVVLRRQPVGGDRETASGEGVGHPVDRHGELVDHRGEAGERTSSGRRPRGQRTVPAHPDRMVVGDADDVDGGLPVGLLPGRPARHPQHAGAQGAEPRIPEQLLPLPQCRSGVVVDAVQGGGAEDGHDRGPVPVEQTGGEKGRLEGALDGFGGAESVGLEGRA
jgi:hypothetical protein